ISKYFKTLTPAEMIPAKYRQSGYSDYLPGSWSKAIEALDHDEFFLDPTRVTLLCGRAGYDGTEFKALLAEDYDIQINKTSRNSVLVQININNTRSDLAHIIKALAGMARAIERRLTNGGNPARTAFDARVKSLMEDVPDLPNFSKFHDAFRAGKMAIVGFAPPLDKFGNSVRAQEAIRYISEQLDLSIFGSS